ncbi:hypothetical protein D3C87_645730 [compost metagenome]
MDLINIKQLESILRKKISVALHTDVAESVKETMKDKIEEEVYSVYSPSVYERQREHGGLLDEHNMIVDMINDTTMTVESQRMDEGRNVSEIVETGQGYNPDWPFPYEGVPRPFTEATREQIHNDGSVHFALYKGLKRQGLDVQK